MTAKRLNAGLDVAGPGEDETVLVVRDGDKIILEKAWPDPDPRGEIVLALNPYKARLENINVDTIGIGYYLARHLEDLDFPVSDVNVGESANDTERYSNKKAEYYWALRMRLEAGDIANLVDEYTIAQLAGIRYKTNARGQIQIESKEDARKRGVKSPDRAEGVMLAYAPSQMHGLLQYWEEQALERKALLNRQSPVDELSQAQKDGLNNTDKEKFTPENPVVSVARVNTLGKVQVGNNTSPICPQCGNRFIGLFAQGRWRCNGCGASGSMEELKVLLG
jgi:hypothetical protein